MIVRRYVVKDMPEAVMSIRKDLGKDAVILSTKKVKVKKWLGLRWQTCIEVTAAVGADIPLYHRDVARPPAREERLSDKRNVPAGTSSRGEQANASPSSSPSFQPALENAFSAYQAAAKQSSPETTVNLKDVLDELAALRELVSEQSRVSSSGKSALQESCGAFLQRQGLDQVQTRAWLDRAFERCSDESSFDDVLNSVFNVINEEIGSYTNPLPISSDSRVVAFVGPTGVGKTTSIAKIAALHVLAGQRKIGLITMDTFRIGAVQQLQTYADILGIPLVVADDDASINAAVNQLQSCDLLLVDTAGRNFRDEATVTHTSSLLNQLNPDETILVVSLTAKPEDADMLVQVCEPLRVTKFLFTKLDETDSVGVIARLLAKYHLPMSYVTTGQNVPDDIDVLPLDVILSKWAGGEGHE
ncbi:flagellar biosynthesis protein FlhF [Alicyclobacillus dauci]|uniref:Flagellar biosynthesis protein FlhF n=1 Tax=Alicyclobacillus dauci TaxID=1475485 RepID=A0ABY6YYP5_9BACL|nr:flagellar biosynthesis protein FlhF [Alicyclobacillus dauci]WAH35388.1 flagellar biosynthesis protein FlhF [Alicyclobacillus dauci]